MTSQLLELVSVIACLAIVGPLAGGVIILVTWGKDLKDRGIKLR